MMGINDYFWSDLFDKIYVVSLPESKDRRSYVAEHLKGVGIRQFEWFDACGPDHPDVKSLFEQQKVRQFPPCFRCGKLSCGSDECNNILIPQQVAVFATYLRLWRQIASSNETALILEDDVRIHEQFAPVLSKLKHWVDTGELEFEAKTPKLLRLGWAYGSDHEAASKDVRVSQEIRMANPCHAMTSAFARIVIEKFEDVSHTADVFLHRDVAEDHQAVTIFPPIASELSWSVGSLPSLIHPKAKRVDYLIEQGLRQEADDYQESIRHHRNHIYHRKFLIVGHPRTGTGFAASLLRQMGFDIGHETDGVDGVASWMMSVDDPKNPWAGHPIAERRSNLFWDHCLHVVRNPMTALPAITRENQYAPKSLEFRRNHILDQLGIDIADTGNDHLMALASLLLWTRLIWNTSPNLSFRLEDGSDTLRDYLDRQNVKRLDNVPLDLSPVNQDKLYKGLRYPKPEVPMSFWTSLPSFLKNELDWYCDIYGYSL